MENYEIKIISFSTNLQKNNLYTSNNCLGVNKTTCRFETVGRFETVTTQ